MQQNKLLEDLQSIEWFAESLLKKCYSVKQQLSLGGIDPRATIKKNSQSKINQVIQNRNKAIRKAKKMLFIILFLSTGTSAQSFSVPVLDSLLICIDVYYDSLAAAETLEFKETNKKHWLTYIPSPGYSPFTGGFTFSLNLSAPIQELKNKRIATQKIQSIRKVYHLQAETLKNEVFVDYKALENSIIEFHQKDSLVYFTHLAFDLRSAQYLRNEITPSDFLREKISMENFKAQRLADSNNIYKSILQLIMKSKKPMHSNAPAF